jgi:acylglycerol lipase
MRLAATAAAALCFVISMTGCSTPRPSLAKPVMGAKEWSSYDGKIMPWTAWMPADGAKPRAVVIAIHGLSGAASDFWYLGERLSREGIAVYGYELRGQGNDPNADQRGDIQSAKQWRRDLETFHQLVRKRHPGKKVFWYGESLGSLIALHTAAARLSLSPDPDGVILASPIAGLRVAVSDFRKWLLLTASNLAPSQRYTLGELSGADESKIRVTSSTTHGGQMAVTSHHVTDFTLRLLGEMGRMMDRGPDAARNLTLPVLFLASPNDVISSPDQVQSLFSQIRAPKKELHWYSRSYHLLLHDVQRESVADDVLRWIAKRENDRKTHERNFPARETDRRR